MSTILTASQGRVNTSREQRFIEALLDKAGIQVNGAQPWDIKVHNPKFYRRVLWGGSLAFGESYMNGWWDCTALDMLIEKIIRAKLDEQIHPGLRATLYRFLTWISNEGRRANAFRVGETHYDLGNELFQAMLDDPHMAYSCGYWSARPQPLTIEQAQFEKLDLVCRKMGLQPGMRVLEIGCGWGSFAKFAAERYGVGVVGLTVSREQMELGRKRCHGLPIEFRLQDYRDVTGEFDRVVSIAMFENVFYRNYRAFFQTVRRVLKEDGLFLLHTFGSNQSVTHAEPWFHKYIFKTGMIPSLAQIGRSVEQLFIIEDIHNFGADYAPTLLAWYRNFVNAWPRLKDKYDDRFYRMWSYYLLSLAGGFRARNTQLWQMVMSPHGVPGGYNTVR